MLYELVVGRPPFTDASPILVLHRQLDEDPIPPNQKNPAVSAPCNDLIMTMLQKDRDDRFADWDAVIAAINKTLAVKPEKKVAANRRSNRTFSTASPRATLPPQPVPASTSGTGNWLYVLLALAILGLVAFLIFR